jgi:hypothetical protein
MFFTQLEIVHKMTFLQKQAVFKAQENLTIPPDKFVFKVDDPCEYFYIVKIGILEMKKHVEIENYNQHPVSNSRWEI